MSVALFDFSTQTAAPPIGNQVRFNAAAYPDVTRLFVWNLTTDGIDIFRSLLAIPVGATLYVQDKNDHTLAVAFTLVLVPIDQGTYVELPVAFVSAAGALNNNQAIVFVDVVPAVVVPPPTPAPPWPPIPVPELLTLADAKTHLRITTPAGHPGDADIQAKLTAAQAIIVDYCATTEVWRGAIATWTPATAPQEVRAAILLELGELYRFRGDDTDLPMRWDGTDLAPAILGLLRRTRDPVVA